MRAQFHSIKHRSKRWHQMREDMDNGSVEIPRDTVGVEKTQLFRYASLWVMTDSRRRCRHDLLCIYQEFLDVIKFEKSIMNQDVEVVFHLRAKMLHRLNSTT